MKKLALFLSIIMLAALSTGIAFAIEKKAEKVEVLTGEVILVDAENGEIIIMSDDKESTLKAQPKMLEGIMAGQYVKIEKTGDEVKSIKVEKNEEWEYEEPDYQEPEYEESDVTI